MCYLWASDSSDKLRQPKIGALMKQVMGAKEDVPGTFSRGGECIFNVHFKILQTKPDIHSSDPSPLFNPT